MNDRLRPAILPLAAFVALTLALTPACASLGPPAWTSGPVTSRAGATGAVELAVVGKDCSGSPDYDYPDESLDEATVEVRLTNTTPEEVTLQRDHFRLVTPEGYALRTLTWGAAEPVTVARGETRSFTLRFMARGGLRCDAELRLEARDGVLVGRSSVPLEAVRFVPWRPRSEAAGATPAKTAGAT